MKYRKFGKTGETVSALGFGCMRFPTKKQLIDGVEKDVIDEELAIPMVRTAIDKGLNYLDTAYGYHGGLSEGFVSKVVEDGYREKVFIADKFPAYLLSKEEDIERYFNEQMARLKVDKIDFYLIHTLNKRSWEVVKRLNLLGFIEEKKKEGKIGHIGFSFHDNLDVFKEIVDSYDWEFVQIQLNYIDEEYQAGIEGLKYAADKGMGVVIMEPLRGGNLVNRLPKEIDEKFKAVHEDYSAARWALRYLYDKDEVSIILSGMSTMDQVLDNLETADLSDKKLSDKEKEAIEYAKNVFKAKIKVNCTQCGYCMPCPYGVDIPEHFRTYNNASLFDEREANKKKIEDLKKEKHGADNCVNCRACMKRCPQGLAIPKLLDEVVDYFK